MSSNHAMTAQFLSRTLAVVVALVFPILASAQWVQPDNSTISTNCTTPPCKVEINPGNTTNTGVALTAGGDVIAIGVSTDVSANSTSGPAALSANAPAGEVAAVLLRSGGAESVHLRREPTSNDFTIFTSNAERLRITAGGNVGIGTNTPAEKLAVNGNALVTGTLQLGSHLGPLAWTNIAWSSTTGYVKLITPIVHNESNMFSIKIVGYRYNPTGDSIDIRCSGYAYGATTLIQYGCQVEGTALPVEIATETRPGQTVPVVVIRIGTPTTVWYYGHFSAQYTGWQVKSPNAFQWTAGETTPGMSANMNSVVADDNAGTLVVGASGASTIPTRLTVNGGGNVAGHLNATDFSRLGGLPSNGVYGWGMDTTLDLVPGGRQAYVLQHHTGLNLAAHSAYGGIRFFNQGYPSPYNQQLVMSMTNGRVGIGTASPSAKLHVEGDVYVSGNIAAKYQDVAEWVPSRAALTPGTVVVLDPSADNTVMASWTPYDTTVAGVVSAQPGIILGEKGVEKERIATTGRVKVRVDATRAAIRIGDLLVTSNVSGTAMKSSPLDLGGVSLHRPGTIVGKALEPLQGGVGEILVLLSLQ